MDQAGLVFGVVGVVGVVAGVVAALWGRAQYRLSRRRRVTVSWAVTPLIRGQAGTDLDIKLRGSAVIVTEPHSVTLRLTAVPPNDVATDAFGGKPLRIEYGAPTVSVIGVDGHPEGAAAIDEWNRLRQPQLASAAPIGDWPSYLNIPAALLSISEPWVLNVMCDGAPTPHVASKLAQVDFIESTLIASSGGEEQLEWVVRLGLLGLLIGGILTFAFSSTDIVWLSVILGGLAVVPIVIGLAILVLATGIFKPRTRRSIGESPKKPLQNHNAL